MIIIKDIQYITDIEKLKVISDPLRISILTTLGTEKKNSKELAKLLKINRTKIHYHLNILEENKWYNSKILPTNCTGICTFT